MLVSYAVAMPIQSLVSGADSFLMVPLIPAVVLLIQIYWMMGASARLREKLLPQLNYADFLCLFRYDLAVDGLYHGALFVADLRGFKRITELKKISPRHAEAVRKLLDAVHVDLMRFAERDGRVVFRFKKNGDEWIWAFFAKDEKQSIALYCDLMSSWARVSGKLIGSWRKILSEGLGEALTPEDSKVVDLLGMHVISCPLRGMRIDVGNDMSRPDFEADEFTTLSAVFKITRHNLVGTTEADAAVLSALHPELGFTARPPTDLERKAAGVAVKPPGVVLLEWEGQSGSLHGEQDDDQVEEHASLPSAS